MANKPMTYFAKLGLDYSAFIGGLSKSSQGMLAFARDVTVTMNMTMMIFDRVMRYGQDFVNLSVNAGKLGKAIKDNARDLGLSTTQFQQWTHAAIASGSSAEEITGSIRMMSVRMKDATDETTDIGKALKTLGISATDTKGNLRPMNDLLIDIFGALNNLPEGFDRNQASMIIFGRNFSNLADLASLSRTELQRLLDQAPVIDDEKIAKLDTFNTQMSILNERIGLVQADIGEQLIPAFEDFFAILGDDTQWSPFREFLNNVATAFNDAAFGAYSFTTGLKLIWLEGARGRGELGGGPEAQKEYDRLWQEIIDKGAKREANMRKAPTSATTITEKMNTGEPISASERAWAKKNEPALYNMLPAAKAPTPSSGFSISSATDTEKTQVDALTTSWKEYNAAINDVYDDKKKLSDLNQNYVEDIQGAGRDVGSMRAINTNFVRQRRTITGNLDTDVSEAVSAATSYNAIKGGAALESVKGTPQYEQAQAKKGLSGITITGPIYLNGDKSFETYLSSQLLRNGVSP